MLNAGSACVNITPEGSCFLFGYPHVARWSTGVHDALMSSAVYLSDGRCGVLFISNDVIFIPRDLAGRARQRIEEGTGVAGANVMITATHTHSGPITVDYLSNAGDAVVPKADPAFLTQLEDGIVAAAVGAVHPDSTRVVGTHWILPGIEPGSCHWRMQDGPLTVCRFDGDRGEYRLCAGEGFTCDGPKTQNVYAWMSVADWPKWERTFIMGPYIHHVAAAYGHHAEILKEAARYLPGVTWESPDE